MDLFDSKDIKPMLIGHEGEAFNDPEYLYELKFDGARCIAYLGKETDLRNKRNINLNRKFPELINIHRQIKKPCILDGEVFVMINGKPNFAELQRRTIMSNTFKIELTAAKLPASFVAFDILYLDGQQLTGKPLIERKRLLEKAVKENERIALSRYIEEKGIELYSLAEQQDLEGIVAKPKNSKYYFDKRSKDWIKIKNLKDDDFVICGYIKKSGNISSLVLGQYRGRELAYKGHVTLGVSGHDFQKIQAVGRGGQPFKETPNGNDDAVWIEPVLVGVVKYMEKTKSGSLRQPVFKGLRDDKTAEECIEQ